MEDIINNLEKRNFEITQSGKNKEKRMKRRKESLHDLWDLIKCKNIKIVRVPETEECRKWIE